MADDAVDVVALVAQAPLQLVDGMMHRLDAQAGVGAAVKIHHQALRGLAHAHRMHVADRASGQHELAHRGGDRGLQLDRRIAAGDAAGFHRLDVGLHLDFVAEIAANGGL